MAHCWKYFWHWNCWWYNKKRLTRLFEFSCWQVDGFERSQQISRDLPKANNLSFHVLHEKMREFEKKRSEFWWAAISTDNDYRASRPERMPSKDSPKKNPRKNASHNTERKKRLVNVYSPLKIEKDWIYVWEIRRWPQLLYSSKSSKE